jgi:outer membrane protein assembly factor BamE
MIIRFIFALLIATTTATGCKLIYKQNIQQGNAIEQDDLDELYIGMNQRQVLFVLGTPSVKDPFHQDRWDYVQTFSRRGNPMVKRTVTLRFENAALSEIVGQNDPFGATSSDSSVDSTAVACFVKKPTDSGAGTAEPADTGTQSPQDASVDAVQEEVLQGVDPAIDIINERDAQDREYQRDGDMLDQTPDDDPTAPDIDG